jgi:predicted CXXCH cytochrome family protein
MKPLNKTLVICAAILSLTASFCLAAETAGTVDPVSGKPCYKCHRSKVSAPKIHDALAGNECGPCHKNTGGDHQKNHALYAVKDRSAKLCWECHDAVANLKNVHPVISEEGCLGCHAPHSSSLRKLLRDEPPALCYQCHDRGLVKERETRKATAFRDGGQNLHWLHAGDKKIACLSCHEVHSSAQQHLIRPQGTNGKEAVTITYTATQKGGNCTTSCHDNLAYERKE